jgi:2-haloacid dehalogenase
MALPKAFAFDVFGTVVDWRTSIARESGPFLCEIGRADIDAEEFADAWRGRYIKVMTEFSRSGRDFVVLDVLHREMLEDALNEYGVDPAGIDDAILTDWNNAWHRLDPWPDSPEGLARLKTKFPIVTLSNGNVALMVEMAKRGNLPWDAILGAEYSRSYKPDPKTYLGTVAALGLQPHEVCLVAAHHGDLAAARALGMQGAYVARPMEYGGKRAPDADMVQDWEFSATSMTELAALVGC